MQTAALQLKLASDNAEAGSFTGYASTPDLDRSRDVIDAGAWSATLNAWAARGGRIPLLYLHRQDDPVGAITSAKATSRGLEVAGQIAVATPTGAVAYELAKVGGLSLSIGYTIPDGGARTDPQTGVRHIAAVDLWEVSLVPIADNPSAIVTGIKTAGDCKTIREFEGLVRDALGLSNRTAKAVASKSWPILHRDDAEHRRDGETLDALTTQRAVEILRRSTPSRA